MRSSFVCIASLFLSTVNVPPDRCVISPLLFPRPALPVVIGNIGVVRLPVTLSAFLASSACLAILASVQEVTGSPRLPQEHNVSLDVVSDPGCVLLASPYRLAGCCLPLCQTLGPASIITISGLNPVHRRVTALSITPRDLSVYASSCPLPFILQDSIQGCWLGFALVGFAPTCSYTISGTHWHNIYTCPCHTVHRPAPHATPSSTAQHCHPRAHMQKER